MDESLRLFIAIDLPSEVKALLHEIQQRLRRHTTAVRWADPQGTHLTLKFLGETRAATVPAIMEGMQHAAARNPVLTLQTEAPGVFPNSRRPRIVWLGVGGDIPALRRLHSDVERFVAPLGFPTEQRPFAPHLTLGRSTKEPRAADYAAISHAVEQTQVLQKIVFSVTEVVLMRSELSPGGARYTPIAQSWLDGAI